MQYYYIEHLAGYERIRAEGLRSWGELQGHPYAFEHFASRPFLEQVLPKLSFDSESPRALDIGSGTGPAACFLAQRGFAVDGIDLIPTAVDMAREIAAERGLAVHYEVMDVTELPLDGIQYDLVVDSYCLQGIVLDSDRRKLFTSVLARLRPCGYYLISSAMYSSHRHHRESRVVDSRSGKAFDRFDEHDLFDPDTEIMYSLSEAEPGRMDPVDSTPADGVCMEGRLYVPRRRYRSAQSLRRELEAQGFRVLLQTGELGQHVVCVQGDGPVLDL